MNHLITEILHLTISLKAFAKRVGAVVRNKGKKKELSPQDAAMMIQMTFRAYLIRRSQALRNLRELAVAKAKLKEIRALFNNFSYRRHVAQDAAERQRFSEKIIVLLLTVDAIEVTSSHLISFPCCECDAALSEFSSNAKSLIWLVWFIYFPIQRLILRGCYE